MVMKINELMIGDWVSVNGLNLKVGAIHADEIGVFDPDYKIYWCSDDGLDRIDPIPLTEEILVKNGFEKRYFDYDFSYDLYEDDNVSFVRLYDHGEGVFFTETSGGDILIKYVHQLQHLLRLVGVQKEIEL